MKTILVLSLVAPLLLVGCPLSGPGGGGGGADAGATTNTPVLECGIYCGATPEGELRANCQAIFGVAWKVVRQCLAEDADPAHCKNLPLPAPSACPDGSIHPVFCCER